MSVIAPRKNVLVKILTAGDEPIGVLEHVEISSFTKEINGGLGECVLKLAEKFDWISAMAQPGNNVEIHVYDAYREDGDEAPSSLVEEEDSVKHEVSKLIYSGYVSIVEREIGRKESVSLRCVGHHTKLALDVFRDGTTASYNFASAYVGAIFKEIIDKFRTNTGSTKIFYDSEESLSQYTEPHIGYLFEQKTYREAMDVCRAYATGGEYYYVDARGMVTFRPPASEPKHDFIFGKHFNSIRVVTNMEKLRNQVLFWNGVTGGGSQVYKKYEDAVSVAKYGPRLEKIHDYGVSASTTSDSLAARLLADAKDPATTVEVEIFDSNGLIGHKTATFRERRAGYDIEAIEPGHTCRFLGFDETTVDFLGHNMLITGVTYMFDRVKLTIDVLRTGAAGFDRKVVRDLSKIQGDGAPTTYTT